MAVVAFLEVSHSLGRGFPAGFRRGAHCSTGNLVLQFRGPHLRIWRWWRRRVRMMPTACGDSDSRSFRTKRSRSVAMGNQLAVRLAGSGGPILVASRSEVGWPKPVLTSLAGFAGRSPSSSSFLVNRHRSRQRAPRDQQKCASVPDFRRTRCSLLLRRVKW